MTRRTTIPIAMAILLLIPGAALAQPDKGSDWTGFVAGGWALAQGDAADAVKDGWTLSGGAVFKPGESPIGLAFGLEYAEYDLTREIVDFFEGTGGDVEVWAFTVGGMWSTRTQGPVDLYVAAGGGVYDVTARIYDVGIVSWPPVCDPWTWWCYPGGIGPGVVVKDSESTTKFGWHAAVGVTFETAGVNQFFVEARWQQIQTKASTDLVPIVVGFRW